MRLKSVSLIFLVILIISSCTTFRPLPTRKYVINGIFSANYKGRDFYGFFSLNNESLKLDIINTLGFSVYGIYVTKGKVIAKNYQNGKVYSDIRIGNDSLGKYKSLMIYMSNHFVHLCDESEHGIIILRCKEVNGFKLPVNIVLFSGNTRLRINLKKVKVFMKGNEE